MQYRPDIDGLRAVAVMPVVLFHAGFAGVLGGYVGVDVFFVISGYLITGIVLSDIQAGRYSLLAFYERRVRRIFPALFVMMAVVAACALAVMLPAELAKFGQSMLSATLFASNVHFYLNTGYFAGAAHDQPLLHTWSLAVEEQFYLFWPLVLAWAMRGSVARARWLCLGLGVASLVLSRWLADANAMAGFYLVFSRTWELLLGAALCLFPRQDADRRPWDGWLAALGLLMIAWAVKFFNGLTPFPSWYALLPTLGAALVIRYAGGGSSTTLVGRGLAWRPVVFVGQVSFSLYLWHWPVMVLSNIWFYNEDTLAVRLAEVGLSMLLAVLSWRWVEQPFRQGRWTLSGPATRQVALALMVAFTALGTCLTLGWPGAARLDAAQRQVAAFESYDGDARYRGGSCFIVGGMGVYDERRCLGDTATQRRRVLLIGDSHAAHLWPGLEAVYGQQMDILQATETGCRPLLGSVGGVQACRRFFDHIMTQWLVQHPVDVVVLAGRWSPADLPGMGATIQHLKAHARTVLVVGPVPQYVSSLPRLLVNSRNDPATIQRGLVSSGFRLDAQLRRTALAQGARYFSVLDSLCVGRSCQVYAQDLVPMQFDYGHFTVEGSTLVARRLGLGQYVSSAL